VRFSGAYHGWWGDVQPGLGNPTPADRTYTLAEMSEQTLRVLRRRRNIACVLVNPLQGLHPNGGAPAESSLVANRDGARFDRDAYTAWLRDLRAVCDQRGIALIFDEVFMGFRLARGGAQDYFGVRADLVTYGKTLGGGLPIGVLCGRHALMKRFRDDRPADVCFARGTFNSHPYVMGAMDAFLRRIDEPDIASLYDNLDAVWERRAAAMNHALAEADLPLRVAHMSSVWTVCHTKPSRYNWMLQYYLRAEGIALSWVGTGRLIFSLNYSDVDFDAVVARFVAAGRAMREDGWWWVAPGATSRSVKRAVLREMLSVRLLGRPRREPVLPR
jgi:glutamate-1-semialdehyde 2,1-aminomutase